MPCARQSWPYRPRLSTRKYTVSYRIVRNLSHISTKSSSVLTDFEYLERHNGVDMPEVDVPGGRADVVCCRQQHDDADVASQLNHFAHVQPMCRPFAFFHIYTRPVGIQSQQSQAVHLPGHSQTSSSIILLRPVCLQADRLNHCSHHHYSSHSYSAPCIQPICYSYSHRLL